MTERPSWDVYGLLLAQAASSRADCTRRQVGAVIMAEGDHQVLGVGFNGAPAGVPGCLSEGNCPRGQMSYEECPKDSDYSGCIADHAERNAVRFSSKHRLRGSTIYITDRPCPGCHTLIKAAGIVRAVWLDGGLVSEATVN